MADIEEFFTSTPEPSDIQLVARKVEDFVDFHKKSERRIVLITVSKIVQYIESSRLINFNNFYYLIIIINVMVLNSKK